MGYQEHQLVKETLDKKSSLISGEELIQKVSNQNYNQVKDQIKGQFQKMQQTRQVEERKQKD